MKTFFITIIALLPSLSAYCQAPTTIKYQAVIRDADGQVMANTDIQLVFTILPSSGSQVYGETQDVTTNQFGLVSLEIGAGEGAATFSAIDWSKGGYSLKVDLDGDEISNNTILAVPYALQATSAINASYASSVSDVGLSHFTNDAGYLTAETALKTNYIAGDGLTLTDSTFSEKKYRAGDFAQGGIVFWVDETGEHGLVCTINDQSTATTWYAGTNGYTRVTGNGIYAGDDNTTMIMAAQMVLGDNGSKYAARLCYDLQVTQNNIIYGDWYLPSSYEMSVMYDNKSTIDATALANGGGAFSSGYYWSSVEGESTPPVFAKRIYFTTGVVSEAPKSESYYVRAIRRF